jgi:transposase-like protein
MSNDPFSSDGSKVLIHLSLGSKESCEDWLEHLRDLVRRGLGVPLTVTTDGAPGLIRAVEAIWPEAERIRCWVHKMRNVRTTNLIERSFEFVRCTAEAGEGPTLPC